MDFKELIILAVSALRQNLLRTLLTMLGIIIGIAAVITIVTAGAGAKANVINEVSSLGSNLITVSAGMTRSGRVQSSSQVSTLTVDDAQAISELENVVAVSPVVSTQSQAVVGSNNTRSTIYGVSPEYMDIRSLSLSQGQFISSNNNDAKARVVVLGSTVAEDLFGTDAEILGKLVRIDSKPFTVIGVLNSDGGSSFNSADSAIFMPYTSANTFLTGQKSISNVYLTAEQTDLIDTTISNIEDLLLYRHNISSIDSADFSVRSSQDMIESISSITTILTTVLSVVAAISLLVGGIGIMNIMLVTVTERTKEIGLLKAIGAKRKDILAQFMVESITLTMIGGLVGMVLGIGLGYIATLILSLPFSISIVSAAIAIGVSVGTGVIFGIYPAAKAAKLNPIEALRHE